tara:strand:+ start:2423 stop:3307 length:885 start_codon:yes stop_codon:yes gene_type:complete
MHILLCIEDIMIDLKRNSKKQPIRATGLRSRNSSSYSPYQKENFKISRGKFSNFLTCKRCFYLDRVKGLDPPGTPGWTLNETTDLLLKREFDYCRERQIPHRVFIENQLSNVVPFNHPEIDNWRDSLHKGLMLRHKDTNIILTGGVDDIWQHNISKQLIIVDYKSQAKLGRVDKQDYLQDPYHEAYKIQMDFYAYLISGMGFDVHQTSYFLVCNAKRDYQEFNKRMNFDEYLVPYDWNIDWIENKIDEMVSLMNDSQIPDPNPSCKNCAYAEQYAKVINNELKEDKVEIQGSLF